MNDLPKFKAGMLVRLKDSPELQRRPDILPLRGLVWMLEGKPYWHEDKWRWHIPPYSWGTRVFVPAERVLERVDQPPEKGNWDDCAWNPYTSTDKE